MCFAADYSIPVYFGRKLSPALLWAPGLRDSESELPSETKPCFARRSRQALSFLSRSAVQLQPC